MLNRRTGPLWGLALAALALLAGSARPADDEAALRKKVLAFNHITGDDTVRGQILTLIDDPAGTKKLLPVAAKMAKETPSPLKNNTTYILARAGERLKDQDNTVALYRACIEQANKVKSPTRLFSAYAGIIATYYAAGKYDDADKVCQEFLELPEEEASGDDDPEAPKYNLTLGRGKELIRRERIQILSRQGKFDEANKVVDRLLDKDKDDLEALELRALLQAEAGKHDEAVKTYQDMIAKVNDAIDKLKKNTQAPKEARDALVQRFGREVRRFRYSQSSLYIDANQVDKAADVLKGLLKEEPDNPSYNNDLGYIWADHDMNLAESEKLIRKAIDEDKKQQQEDDPELKPEQIKANPAYLDSLGWVLFKQKKYKDALPPLEDAVKEEEGQHIEIFDHLAEVHMALGNKAAAVSAWKKGMEHVGTSKREQERKAIVEKKLKEQQEKK
jgi:tetratricopeptide (TPR) repeat protein